MVPGIIKKLYHTTAVGLTDEDKQEVYPITATAAVYSAPGESSFPNMPLNDILDALNQGYHYMGKATPSTNPGTFNHKVFYLASEAGNYPHFGNITVSGLTALKSSGGGWSKDEFNITGGGGGQAAGYIGTTLVQSAPQEQALTGITQIDLTASARIYFGSNAFIEHNQYGFHFSDGLYSDGFVSAGGVSSGGGGGGGGSIVTVTQIQTTGTKIATITVDGVPTDLYAPNGGGNSGTVTSVGLTVPTGLSVSGSPVTSSGTLTISYASGYSIPLTDDTAKGVTAYGWGNHAQAGYALATDLAAVVTRVSNIENWFEVVTVGNDTALHAKNGYAIYSDSWISAGGIGNSGGGGSSVSWGTESGYTVPLTVEGVTKTLLMNGALTGYATQQWVGQQGYLTSYTETDPTVPSWAKQSSKPSYALSEITGASDVQAIEALTGTTGLLKKTATNTWTLDTTAYLSSHQTIYALTFAAGSFTAGTYTPNSAAKSINVPTTLDHIEDGTNRKLADYLPLTGGTMTGAITMSGANILTATDSTNQIGAMDHRFRDGYIRNVYLTYLGYRTDDGQTHVGNIGMGSGYAQVAIVNGNSTSVYTFNATYGFFHGGNGDVPCGRSDHRWSYLYGVNADLSGSLVVGGDIVPAADITSSLGYSGRRFTSGNIVNVYTRNIYFKHQSTGKTDGLIAGGDGYFRFRTGADIDTAYKDIVFHETYGFYPEQSGVNLGYNGANFRWANIYGVNGNLSGDLTMTSTSHIDIGSLRIEYDATNKALHITKVDSNDPENYGIYADGFVAAGGVQQTS